MAHHRKSEHDAAVLLAHFMAKHEHHRGYYAKAGDWSLFVGCDSCNVYEDVEIMNEARERARGALETERAVTFGR